MANSIHHIIILVIPPSIETFFSDEGSIFQPPKSRGIPNIPIGDLKCAALERAPLNFFGLREGQS